VELFGYLPDQGFVKKLVRQGFTPGEGMKIAIPEFERERAGNHRVFSEVFTQQVGNVHELLQLSFSTMDVFIKGAFVAQRLALAVGFYLPCVDAPADL